jgi:hypothetical protein
MRRLRGISESSFHGVGEEIPDSEVPDPRKILDGPAVAASVDQARAARTSTVDALRCTEQDRPEPPEGFRVGHEELLDEVLSVGRPLAVRPLGSGPATEIVVDELIVEEDEQAFQEPVEAGRSADIWHVDMVEPKAELGV